MTDVEKKVDMSLDELVAMRQKEAKKKGPGYWVNLVRSFFTNAAHREGMIRSRLVLLGNTQNSFLPVSWHIVPLTPVKKSARAHTSYSFHSSSTFPSQQV